MADVTLVLFGIPRIEYKGQTVRIARRKAFALAAYLALARGPQSRESIAGLLWPDLDDEHARTSLRSTLRALTSAVPAEWITADRSTLQLNPDAARVDVIAFEKLLAQSSLHPHSPGHACVDCVPLYEQAAALYQDHFLAGYFAADSAPFEDWQRIQYEWLRREFSDIHRKLSLYHAGRGDQPSAIGHTRQWLAVDPLHEEAHRHLMRLLAASGQRQDAINQYRQCAAVLDMELASPPENETTLLYEAILNNDVPTAPSGAGASTPHGIMPRLPAMVVGREAVLDDLRRRLADLRPVTVIQGWPGVGKSTIVAMLAHDPVVANLFPDGVMWASLGETPDIAGEITAWMDVLNPGEADRSRKVETMSAQITAALRDRRMLLIVDDVWQAEHAIPFRVGGGACSLVMTSRLNDVASALAPAAEDIYRIPVLAEEAGLELLGRLSPETTTHYPDEARDLVRDLEGLPLAIHVAGRLLHSEESMGWGVRDLLADLRTGAGLLKAQAPSDMLSVQSAGRDASPTVAALLKRSTDLLDEEARHRFAFLGLFVPKPATFDLGAMAAAWGIDDPRHIARRLVNHGLLEPVGGGRFQMHALLVLHARSLLEEEGVSP
jgi:DNA-binding SARP family transcriptional activator